MASIHRVFKDIAAPIIDQLTREFYGQLRNSKINQYLDNRIRTLRYTAELVKFKVCPPMAVFRYFKALFADFNAQNVELLAILMESCGR